MEELQKLIEYIYKKYNEISDNWCNNENYMSINMNKKRVDDIYRDDNLLSYIFKYREFINTNYYDNISHDLEKLGLKYSVNYRLKLINSIQSKIETYKTNHEDGKIVIKKCLNDILGFRMILDEKLEYNKINNFVSNNYPKLKCIRPKKMEYKAIHIYFGNDDNKKFQCELQLWSKENEQSNLASHKKHKQDYVTWEKEENM